MDHVGAVAAGGDADIGLARLAGAVGDAAEHRQAHRRADVLEALLQFLDGADDVEALPRATGARDDADAAVADAERLENLEADADLVLGLCRPRDADRVADPEPQRSEEHTSELQSLMLITYALFCLKKQNSTIIHTQ